MHSDRLVLLDGLGRLLLQNILLIHATYRTDATVLLLQLETVNLIVQVTLGPNGYNLEYSSPSFKRVRVL